jgi:beta-glucanase (GH16 family)
MDSIGSFSLPEGSGGIEFAARVRSPVERPRGIVTSLFGFGLTRGPSLAYKDEVDLEFLSNRYQRDVVPPEVLLNRYVDEPPGPGLPLFVAVPGVELTDFNVFRIRWFSDRIEWYVNDELVQSVFSHIPSDPMGVRLNIWAPGPEWPDAYSAELQPVASASESTNYVYEVDWVRVSEVPLPPAIWLMGPAAFVLWGLRRHGTKRPSCRK